MSDLSIHTGGYQTQPPQRKKSCSDKLIGLALSAIAAYGSYHYLPRNIRGVVSTGILGIGIVYACDITCGCILRNLGRIFSGGGGHRHHSSWWQTDHYPNPYFSPTEGGGYPHHQPNFPSQTHSTYNQGQYTGQPRKKSLNNPTLSSQNQSHTPPTTHSRQPRVKANDANYTSYGGGGFGGESHMTLPPATGNPTKKTNPN